MARHENRQTALNCYKEVVTKILVVFTIDPLVAVTVT